MKQDDNVSWAAHLGGFPGGGRNFNMDDLGDDDDFG